MSRGGHNRKGGGTVETSTSIDVIELARAGYFSGPKFGGLQWSYRDGTTASIGIIGRRDTITLVYRLRTDGDNWRSVTQQIPIYWADCRLGGQRPWFICDVRANGVYCGRRVAKLYGAGRLFACRRCYRLGYTPCSMGIAWIAPTIDLRGCIASSARIITDRLTRRLRSPNG